DAARDRCREAARTSIRVRHARAGRRGALHSYVLVEPYRAAALLRARLEDRAEPLRQPGFVDNLASAAEMRRVLGGATERREARGNDDQIAGGETAGRPAPIGRENRGR